MLKMLFPILALALIAGFSGCAGLKDSLSDSFSFSDKDEPVSNVAQNPEPLTNQEINEGYGIPVEMAVVWQSATYEQPGLPTVSGFGGRVYFYDAKHQPIKVEGDLIVYGFDDEIDDDASEESSKKKFVFRNSEFQSHYSDAGIGASYSIWVPWVKVGGYRKTITLIPVFRLANGEGRTIRAEPSINVIPGETRKERLSETTNKRPFNVDGSSPALIGQAGYTTGSTGAMNAQDAVTEAAMNNGERTANLKTSTFQVPRSLAQRMARAGSAKRPLGQSTVQSFNRDENDQSGQASSGWPSANNRTGITHSGSRVDSGSQNVEPSRQDLPVKSKRRVFGAPGPFN